MTWTAPMTAVAGNTFTAAQYNANVRDNLLETAPAKATTAGGYFVTTTTNSIAERVAGTQEIDTAETRSSTAYGNLATAGPIVTLVTGTHALVMMSAQMQNNANNGYAIASVAVSGTTTIAETDVFSIAWQQTATDTIQDATLHNAKLFTNLTPGSNTFTMKYRALTAGTATFSRRKLTVIPF